MEKSSPLFFHRYELKYHIPLELVNSVIEFISPYCEQDPFSKEAPEGYYTINNLYLDTYDYILLRRRLNKEDRRFNLRVRAYGDGTFAPYFLEVKYKQSGKVQKYRHPLKLDQWKKFQTKATQFDYPVFDPEENISSPNYNKFESIICSINAYPHIQTQYRRLAFFSKYDDYARITFDRDLVFRENNEYDFKMQDFKSYDHNMNFDPFKNVIMELKCTTQVPSWFIDLIKVFEFEKSSFSKYAGAMLDMLPNEQADHDKEVLQSIYL
jgi:SPX domain protein involved in polyphosphate accumulation